MHLPLVLTKMKKIQREGLHCISHVGMVRYDSPKMDLSFLIYIYS